MDDPAVSGIVSMPRPLATSDSGKRRVEAMYGAPGLAGNPFTADPNAGGAASWVAIRSREAVLHALTSWLTDPDVPHLTDGGLAVITGDTGSGRTRLLTTLGASLADRSDLLVATVADDGNRRSDALLLRAMIVALGAAPSGRTGRELIAEVRALVSALLDAGRQPVVLIDNAALSGSQLEIVRMLLVPANGEASAPGTLPGALLVLFGPPELSDRIRRRRALAGMVEITEFLAPLDEAEIAELIEGRADAMPPDALPSALHDGDARLPFTKEAIAIIGRWSGGNPGAVIRIADACLRQAILHGRPNVDRTVALLVAHELTDDAAQGSPGEGLAASAEPVEPIIQTRLDLGFADEEPEPAGNGRPIRNRRRR